MASDTSTKPTLLSVVKSRDSVQLRSGGTHVKRLTNGFPRTLCTCQGDLEMVLSIFTDRWVIFCSDVGKIGSIIECSIENKSYNVEVLLGDREDLSLRMLARQLKEKSGNELPLLLMVGFKTTGLDNSVVQSKLRSTVNLFENLLKLL